MFNASRAWTVASVLLLSCGGESEAASGTGGYSGIGGNTAPGGTGAAAGGTASTGGASAVDNRCPAVEPVSTASCTVEGLTCLYHYSTRCLCATNSTTNCTQVNPSCTGSGGAAGVPNMPNGGAAAFIIPATGGSASNIAFPMTGGSNSRIIPPATGGESNTLFHPNIPQCTCTNSLWGCTSA